MFRPPCYVIKSGRTICSLAPGSDGSQAVGELFSWHPNVRRTATSDQEPQAAGGGTVTEGALHSWRHCPRQNSEVPSHRERAARIIPECCEPDDYLAPVLRLRTFCGEG